jgi:hypothetical protein
VSGGAVSGRRAAHLRHVPCRCKPFLRLLEGATKGPPSAPMLQSGAIVHHLCCSGPQALEMVTGASADVNLQL